MRRLWQHRYLERPRAIRPTKILTEELVYALGRAGARLLEREYPDLRGIGARDWDETPRKQRSLKYVDHQLGIATVMVCLRVAAERHGAELRWDGHPYQKHHRFHVPGMGRSRQPDAYFAIRVPERGVAHHYLEVDRGWKQAAGMQERYEDYFRFWRNGRSERPFRHFRVLTVADNPTRLAAYRKAARPVGRGDSGRAWRALMFSDFTRFGLDEPEGVVYRVWCYADSEEPVGLV